MNDNGKITFTVEVSPYESIWLSKLFVIISESKATEPKRDLVKEKLEEIKKLIKDYEIQIKHLE